MTGLMLGEEVILVLITLPLKELIVMLQWEGLVENRAHHKQALTKLKKITAVHVRLFNAFVI